MKLETFNHTTSAGWSVATLPPLDSERTLVIMFGAPDLDPGPIHEIARAYPSSHIVGCSTAGEILGTALYDDSLSVGIVQFEHTRVATAIAPVGSADESYATGEALAQRLDDPQLCGILVLSDGALVNGSELVRGLNAALPTSVVVTGGLAGDGTRMERTWVVKDGAPQGGFVSAVGLYGERVRIGHGSKGGWDIFGPERLVTRSEGNILYELDERPALQLYKEYLGDRASGLPSAAFFFPLALRADSSDQKSIVRTILALDEENQSMTFAGDIPQGYLVQLMRANFDRLVDGAADAAAMTQERQQQTAPVLSIAVSCVGRRLVLGEGSEEELEATLDGLPEGTQQIGFYSYGEISPYGIGHCDLHNQTMTLTTISEE